ncbi:MAG: hypothetical protein AB1700_13770 [Bacillota bacterium]
MRWFVVAAVGALAAPAILLIVLLLPLKVSVLFERRDGRNAVLVWVGILYGLIWVPVFRKVPRLRRPDQDHVDSRADEGRPGRTEDGASVVSRWLSRLQNLARPLGAQDERASPQAPDSRKPSRVRRVGRRMARFLYRGVRATGLDVWKLRVRMELGSGEAATSAIGVGVAYALMSGALAASPVPLRFLAGKPDILITPRYDRAGLDASVHCIVAVTPGYIILRGIQAGRTKGGKARAGPRARAGRSGDS